MERPNNRIVLTNAKLLDGDNPPKDGATLVISGERIENVSFAPVHDVKAEDVVYDLGGRTVMPGMVNGHYHATYTGVGGDSFLPVGMEAPPALQTLRAARHLKLALYCGFTGVVSAGAPYAIDASCKQAIEEGLIEGPRIVAGSRDVSTTGHSQDGFAWHWGPGMTAQTNIVDGPDAFRRAIREEVKRGAEIIKIFATAGHAIPGPSGLEVSEDELAAAALAAHQRDARVRAHLAGRDSILAAVRAGIDVVDHGDGLDRKCIDLMLENGTFLVPSLLYPARVIELRPGPMADVMKAEMDKMIAILPEANKSGLKITLGDDFGAVPLDHGTYADELEFYVKVAGMDPLDVIRWATKNGSELMERGHELGTLEQGKIADLLIVDGDPIKDIALLNQSEALLAVMKGGVFVQSQLSDLSQTQQGEKSSAGGGLKIAET